MKKLIALVAVVFLAGCFSPVHNDQRSCTHDCNIGASEPYYAPTYLSPSLNYYRYHRRYRRGPMIIYHW